MSYSWIAVDENNRVIKSRTGRIPLGLNPDYNNNVAEGIALAVAERATSEFPDREFHTDSAAMVLQVTERVRPSRVERIRKLSQRIKGVKIQFSNKNPFIYMVDFNSKGILTGQRLRTKPLPLPKHQVQKPQAKLQLS